MNLNTNEPDKIITIIRKNMTEVISKEADKLIEEQTLRFRQELINKKNIAIVELINTIEIQSLTNNIDNDIRFTVIIKPTFKPIEPFKDMNRRV